MPKISANVLEAVGNTSLVRLNRVTAEFLRRSV
jgi:hypothetical protein